MRHPQHWAGCRVCRSCGLPFHELDGGWCQRCLAADYEARVRAMRTHDMQTQWRPNRDQDEDSTA